ncbi:MAG: energy transducer TonB [Opitutaceae bacterium]|nr:energy transducer TonB [Opitutaceae bacterium]
MLTKIRTLALTLIAAGLMALAARADAPQEQAFDEAPVALRTPMPAYPKDLHSMKIEGRVAVLVEIDEKGAVTNVQVLKSTNSAFDAPALRAVRNWKFTPAKKDKAPVKAQVSFSLKFDPNA